MTILQLQKDVRKNLYKLLYGAAFIIFMAGCWITRNQIKIDRLEEEINNQDGVIKAQNKLINQHEWLTMNHDYRLDRLDNLSSKTKK